MNANAAATHGARKPCPMQKDTTASYCQKSLLTRHDPKRIATTINSIDLLLVTTSGLSAIASRMVVRVFDTSHHRGQGRQTRRVRSDLLAVIGLFADEAPYT